MFAIESWPNGAYDSAPHVRAASFPDALTDLSRQDLDMIVWTRHVPLHWSEALHAVALPETALKLCGTVEEIGASLSRYAGQYPSFVLEDSAHTVALCAALTGLCRFRLELVRTMRPDTGSAQTGLRSFCCYGHPGACWRSGATPQAGIWTCFAPFSLVLIPPHGASRVTIEANPHPGSLYLVIEAI